MEPKPKSIKLIDFKEELLPSGRKLLHCIFKDKYGSSPSYYSWTAPWRDKEGEHGVERLFFKALEIEEWNDYEGAWSDELRKASKEIPSLEAIELPVKIQMGEITEDRKEDAQGIHEYWRIDVLILSDTEVVTKYQEGKKDFIEIGNVRMDWKPLQNRIFSVKRVKFLSGGIRALHDEWGGPIGICFGVWVEKAMDKIAYQVITREIAYRVRRFIRDRLSEYKALKRGFED